MSIRVDTTSLIPGAIVVGDRGLGVLGSQVPSTGTHGPGYIYPSLNLPGDANKEYRGLIVTPPAAGTLVAGEDSSFLLIGAPDGEYSLVFRLFEDGIDLGLVNATFNVGPVDLEGDATGAGTAAGALSVGKPLAGDAVGQGSATGDLAHGVPLGADAAAQGGATEAMDHGVPLGGDAVGAGGATGDLSAGTGLGGAAVGSGQAAGELAHGVPLAADAVGSGAAEGALSGPVSLGGDATGQGLATGQLAPTDIAPPPQSGGGRPSKKPKRRFTEPPPERPQAVETPSQRNAVSDGELCALIVAAVMAIDEEMEEATHG